MAGFLGLGSSEYNNKLDDADAAGIKINLMDQIIKKYPSLTGLNDKIKPLVDAIRNNKSNDDTNLLNNHFEILSVPVFSNQASSHKEVLANIKTLMQPYSIPGYSSNAVREGGKRRARKAKTRKSKKSKRSRGTRRS